MGMPQLVQELLSKSLEHVRLHPEHALSPYQRLEIYDAFGPTYYSVQGQSRYASLDTFQLTHADRVRARLALITAQHVLPLWHDRWQEYELLDAEAVFSEIRSVINDIVFFHGTEQQYQEIEALQISDYAQFRQAIQNLSTQGFDNKQLAVIAEYLDFGENYSERPEQFELSPQNFAVHSVEGIPTYLLPQFLLQLASALLDRTMSATDVAQHDEVLWVCFGHCLGQDEWTFPAQAYDVASACYEAYHQGLGIGPYNRQEVTTETTDADLLGDGAAAASAHKAFAGIFEEGASTEEYDRERQKQFWEWWLQEAIPQAWQAEAHYVEPKDLRTMPFRDTVVVTKYRYGIIGFDQAGNASYTPDDKE